MSANNVISLPTSNKLTGTRSTGGNDGDGPEGPMLEQRVGRLETDVAEIKVSLRGVQDTLIRIEAKMDTFATKDDVAALRLETREGLANQRADANKQFGDMRAETQKLFGDGQIANLRWLFALIIPIYLGLLAFGWQALKALNQPPLQRSAVTLPAPAITPTPTKP
jgi:hypothetical protein